MDISSLLSPEDAPVRNTASPTSSSSRKSSRCSGTALQLPEGIRSYAQPSTAGRDTLADLASMQHQYTPRANAGGFQNTEVLDGRVTDLQALPLTNSNSRRSIDITMHDAPVQAAASPTFVSEALSEDDLEKVTRLAEQLAENSNQYESHTQIIKLLHQGLISHVYGSAIQKNPSIYELLDDLRQANEAMDTKFALGEELWMDRLQGESLLATTFEECVATIELCEKAVAEEAGSTELWMFYGNWMLRLYHAAHPEEANEFSGDEQPSKALAWSEEDKLVATEIFDRNQMMEVWKRAVDETKERIDDSHLPWDRYTDLLLQELGQALGKEAVSAMKDHFVDRLLHPHATWDDTFQRFSSFISTHDNAAYEETMVRIKHQSTGARKCYAAREKFELRLLSARKSEDRVVEWTVFTEYLEWELNLSREKKHFSFERLNALHQRANIRFPTDANLWEEYAVFLIGEVEYRRRDVLLSPVLERACRHCPWSGSLWALYIQAAERENKAYAEIEQIKHKATSSGLLDAGDLDEILKVYAAWCGMLRRQAFRFNSDEEDLDVAEMGIRSAIEDIERLGKTKYGKEYQGDPQYRLERIYIKFLSQSRDWNATRDVWKRLESRHGDSYEFWTRYYCYEMTKWGKLNHAEDAMMNSNPTEATKVLQQAMKRPHLDWPEKMIYTFLSHCEIHENVVELQKAVVLARKATKAVFKRREKEAIDAAELAHQAQAPSEPAVAAIDEYTGAQVKRKRGDEDDAGREGETKKRRPSVSEPADIGIASTSAQLPLKRDRENTSVVVRNLPVGVTVLKVQQFFQDCGTINSLKITPDENGNSATASIEFESKEDVLTAQTKGMKDFDGHVIQVQVGTETTLFVTNFPPAADEIYIRTLFSKYGDVVEIRLPSLKFNGHRRFCYVQFKSASQARAATELNDAVVEGLRLVVKISDPNHKKERTGGALQEGREIHVGGLDRSTTDNEVAEMFSRYGKVEKVRVLRNAAGISKGSAFVVLSSRNQANAALDLNLTKFKSHILRVEIALENPAKHKTTTTLVSADPSIAPSTRLNSASTSEGGSPGPTASPPAASANPVSDERHPTREEIASRTIALLNIPDTVNDARIRALVEPYGSLTKVIMRHNHQGAIVEFKEVASAGRASLGIEGYEIVPGRKIRVGSVAEMKDQKGEWRQGKISTATAAKKNEAAKMLQAGAPIRRPGGRRGGLGTKKGGFGLGFVQKPVQNGGGPGSHGNGNEASSAEGVPAKAKSNADFRALVLNG